MSGFTVYKNTVNSMKIMCSCQLKLWQMYEDFIRNICRKTTRKRPVARPRKRWGTLRNWPL